MLLHVTFIIKNYLTIFHTISAKELKLDLCSGFSCNDFTQTIKRRYLSFFDQKSISMKKIPKKHGVAHDKRIRSWVFIRELKNNVQKPIMENKLWTKQLKITFKIWFRVFCELSKMFELSTVLRHLSMILKDFSISCCLEKKNVLSLEWK